MNNHSLKMLSLLAGLAALGSLSAHAQDKATLDLLVKKNIITTDEAATLAKTSAVYATPKDTANVKGLKIEGMVQSQMDWLSTKDKATNASNPPAEAQFFVRRAYLGAVLDMGNGWGGEILFDFAAGAQAPTGTLAGGGNAAQNLFEKLIITKKLDDWNGTATVGYQKVHFMQEEYTSSAEVKTIERSIMSRYFDEAYTANSNGRLGFANRHNGIFWDGTIPLSDDKKNGIVYGGAFVTGIQNSSGYTAVGGLNKFGAWLYAGYDSKEDENLTYQLGINYGVSPDGNSVNGAAAAPINQSNTIWGYNPYLRVTYNKAFQLDAEFAQAMIDNGRVNGAVAATQTYSRAEPYGFTITPSYKINDEWEVVAKYGYLNTDGRGTAIGSVVRNGSPTNVSIAPAPFYNVLYNDAQQFYVGLNWYIVKNAVKFMIGYEYTEFSNRQQGATAGAAALVNSANLIGPKAEVNGVRARLQLNF